MRYIVDRTEGRFAVCEDEKGNMLDIPLDALPREVKEGSVIDFESGEYFVNDGAQQDRRQKIRDLENDLFE